MRQQTKEIMYALKHLKRARQLYKENDQGLLSDDMTMLSMIQTINTKLLCLEDD